MDEPLLLGACELLLSDGAELLLDELDPSLGDELLLDESELLLNENELLLVEIELLLNECELLLGGGT